jgi:hypothetical protein
MLIASVRDFPEGGLEEVCIDGQSQGGRRAQ